MNPHIKRVDVFFKICDLFNGYKVVFDDVNAKFTIKTPSSTLTLKNNFQEVIQFCSGLSNVPGCSDKINYTHLMNDLNMYSQSSGEPTVENKQEGTKITLLIIKQDREKLANDIADTTKTLLLMEDKTSWMYKQNEKLLTYFKAKYEVVEAQYNLNK